MHPKYFLIPVGALALLGVIFWLSKPIYQEEESDEEFYQEEDAAQTQEPNKVTPDPKPEPKVHILD